MHVVHSEIPSITAEGAVLGRYSLPGEDREVVAYRGPAGVNLFDLPSVGVGESCLIDRELGWDDGLLSLVEEYLEDALRLGYPPAGKQGIGVYVDSLEPGEAEVFLNLCRGSS